MSLAARYHRGAFQAIHDTIDGDGGLEGFSKDALAVGYQCYVPDEIAKRSYEERIIEKINGDTLKLQKNSSFFEKCLDNIKLKRWALPVPSEYLQHNKLAQQAGTRAAAVREWQLPFIDNDFTITVGHGAEFDGIRDECRAFGTGRIAIPSAPPTKAEQDDWETANAAQMQMLDDKLSRTKHPKQAIDAIRSAIIRNAVVAQNAFSRLEREDPDGWERLVKAKAQKRNALEFESGANTALPIDFLKKVKADYQAKVLQEMSSLSEDSALIIADEAIVEWLLSCPLNFYAPEPDGN